MKILQQPAPTRTFCLPPVQSPLHHFHDAAARWRPAGPARSTWLQFYKNTEHVGSRRLLLEALDHVGPRIHQPGLAVDLGCGGGQATQALNARTAWGVHAIDQDPSAERFLTQRFPLGLPPSVNFQQAHFALCHLPIGQVDFLWAGLSLPYLPQDEIGPVWQKINDALASGGIFAGDFFGPKHGYQGRIDMNFHTPDQMHALLADLHIIKCERITQPCPFTSGKIITMDSFHVIAQKR